MTGNRNAPERGEFWFANLAPLRPSSGAEIKKSRPVLIVSNNIVNEKRRTVLAIPLATSGGTAEPNPPITVGITCAGINAVAVVDQLRAVDKQRLVKQMGMSDRGEFNAVIDALSQILQII